MQLRREVHDRRADLGRVKPRQTLEPHGERGVPALHRRALDEHEGGERHLVGDLFQELAGAVAVELAGVVGFVVLADAGRGSVQDVNPEERAGLGVGCESQAGLEGEAIGAWGLEERLQEPEQRADLKALSDWQSWAHRQGHQEVGRVLRPNGVPPPKHEEQQEGREELRRVTYIRLWAHAREERPDPLEEIHRQRRVVGEHRRITQREVGGQL